MTESAIHARLREIIVDLADWSDPWKAGEESADQILSEFDVLYKAEWTPSISQPEDHPDYWRNR